MSRPGDVTWWLSVCLACTRPWVWSPVPHKKCLKKRIHVYTASSTNVAGKSGYLLAEKLKLDPCLSSCASINSK
jgi:hypothetical protein